MSKRSSERARESVCVCTWCMLPYACRWKAILYLDVFHTHIHTHTYLLSHTHTHTLSLSLFIYTCIYIYIYNSKNQTNTYLENYSFLGKRILFRKNEIYTWRGATQKNYIYIYIYIYILEVKFWILFIDIAFCSLLFMFLSVRHSANIYKLSSEYTT